MKKFMVHLILVFLAAPNFALPPNCQSISALIVDDYVIEGQAVKNDQILRATNVSLYSQGKLVRRVATDSQALFILDHLSPGPYRLSIQGLGSFDVKVMPTSVKTLKQRKHYMFLRMRGCLSWGYSTD